MTCVAWRLLLAGFVVLALWGQPGWAASPSGSGAAPAPAGTAPAPAAPPTIESGPMPDFGTLIAGTGLAFRRPDKTKENWRVTYESGSDVIVIDCWVNPQDWKYQDGMTAKEIQFWVQLTPFYTQDVEPSTKLLRGVLEAADKESFTSYSVHTDPGSGQWSLWTNANMFLRGTTSETLGNYLTIVASAAISG